MENRELVFRGIEEVFNECPGNTISEAEAICAEAAGIHIFEKPLVGIGSKEDALWGKYKEEAVVGPWFMAPTEWLSEAKSVVSLFFPFTEEVKASNQKMTDGPSAAWLHGRIEGQRFLNTYMKKLARWLENAGVKAVVPALDSRFRAITAGKCAKEYLQDYTCITEKTFSSNWSERHAAYVCGLGTFGLSKGLITEKGIAGRFASVIIDLEVEPDKRNYTGVYDYCTMCGACVRRCPSQAISLEHGKNHNICNECVNEFGKRYAPRYGCGLCQTKVPCESRIPKRK